MRSTSSGIRVQLLGVSGDVARVGLAVTGVRSAVLRNRIRRRLRAAVSPLLPELRDHDVVLSAGEGAAALSGAALAGAVTTAARRALELSGSAPPPPASENVGVSARGETRR